MAVEIDGKFSGEDYVAVYKSNGKYGMLKRRNADDLEKDLRLYVRGDDSSVVQMYNGINLGALQIVNLAIEQLNEGKPVNLERLLNGKRE